MGLVIVLLVATFAAAWPSLSSSQTTACTHKPEIRYDQNRLIVHKDGGGDTAQREGWYWFGVWLRKERLKNPWETCERISFDKVVLLLDPKADGYFRRAPQFEPFDTTGDGTSRDQILAIVAALGVNGRSDDIRRLWAELPEDALGKHSFAGRWESVAKLPTMNCSEIWRNTCNLDQQCPMPVSDMTCKAPAAPKVCSAKVCTPKVCTPKICKPKAPDIDRWCALDPQCVKKKTDDALRALADCKTDSAAKLLSCQNSSATDFAQCRTKSANDLATCNTKRAATLAEQATETKNCVDQNVAANVYNTQCKVERAKGPAACEIFRKQSYAFCTKGRRFTGDLMSMIDANHFRRAVGEDPATPNAFWGRYGLGGEAAVKGDQQLRCNVHIRIAQGRKDLDNTGNDLNLILMLLMSEERFPTELTRTAVREYADHRPVTYGNYIGVYRKEYAKDAAKLKLLKAKPGRTFRDLVAANIKRRKSPWKAQLSPPLGATLWYHRRESGANEDLALMYGPILDAYLKPGPSPRFDPMWLDPKVCQKIGEVFVDPNA